MGIRYGCNGKTRSLPVTEIGRREPVEWNVFIDFFVSSKRLCIFNGFGVIFADGNLNCHLRNSDYLSSVILFLLYLYAS